MYSTASSKQHSPTIDKSKESVEKGKKSNLETLFIRRAIPEDYLDVVTLRADVPGFLRDEYLIHNYFNILKEPDLKANVAILNNEIISFGVLHVGLDGGKTVLGRTGRIKHELMDQGLGGRILLSCMFDISDMIQNVEGLSYPSFIPNYKDPVHEYRLQWNFESFPAQQGPRRPDPYHTPSTVSVTSNLFKKGNDHMIDRMSVEQLCSLFHIPSLRECLFPSQRFVMDVLLCKAIPENAKYVFKRKEAFEGFISRDLAFQLRLEKGYREAVSVRQSVEPKNVQGLLSYNTWFRHPIGFTNHIEIYGTPISESEVKGHLQHHIRAIRERDLHGVVKVTCEETALALPYSDVIRETCIQEGLYCHTDQPEKRMVASMMPRRRLNVSLKLLKSQGYINDFDLIKI